MRRIIYAVIAALIAASPVCLHAGTVDYVREVTYPAGKYDNRESSRIMASLQVRKLLVDDIGTDVEKQPRSRELQLTKAEIAQGSIFMVRMESLEQKWNGRQFHMKARIKTDPAEIAGAVEGLKKQRAKAKDIATLIRDEDALVEECNQLSLDSSAGLKEGQRKKQTYLKNIRKAEAIESFFAGLYAEAKAREAAESKAVPKALGGDPRAQSRLAMEQALSLRREAINHYDRALKLFPEFALAYAYRGEVHYLAGNPSRAIKDCDQAVAISPEIISAYLVRGLARHKLGNFNQAIDDFNRVISIDPAHAQAYAERGNSQHKLGKLQDAIKDEDKAIELDPQLSSAYFNRGFFYHQIGNYDQALKDITTAAKLGNKWAQDFLVITN